MDTTNDTLEDWNAFTLCYKKHSRLITRFLCKMVKDPHAAEELMQETFLKLLEKQYKLDPNAFKTIRLIATVAKHTAIDYLRRQKSEEKYRQKQLEEVHLNDALFKDLEECSIQSEIVATFHDILSSFPESIREALMDRYYENKSVSAVARYRNMAPYFLRQAEHEFQLQLRRKLLGYFC